VRVASSPDNAGTDRYYRMVRVRPPADPDTLNSHNQRTNNRDPVTMISTSALAAALSISDVAFRASGNTKPGLYMVLR